MHRVPGGRTSTVYAQKSELEAWLGSDPGDADASSAAPNQSPTPTPTPRHARTIGKRTLVATLVAALALVALLAVMVEHRLPATDAPVSISAVASPGASRETLEFARELNADLARFANASPDLAVFERDPGTAPETQYAIHTEIERANGRIITSARLIAAPLGQVIWARRFEQSGPALSALREQVAANLVDILRCSFGGLGTERAKVQPADLKQLMTICERFEWNDLAAAEARARQLTVAHPGLSLGWALLAMIQGNMVGQGKMAFRGQALANSQIAATIAPNGLNTWLAKAAASVGGPTSPEALPIIDAAVRIYPDEPTLLYDRSVILFNLGYVNASVADALGSVRNDPSSFGGRDTAVRRLAAAGRTEEAWRLQAENERLWPGHPQVAANREQIAANRVGVSATDAAEIGELESKFNATPYVAYTLASRFERAGNRQAALAWLARAPIENALLQWSQLFWPDAAGLRTETAFFHKMADLGLVRRWVARRQWPDFCAEPGLRYDCAEEARKLRLLR